jgi:hypothetical protein
MKYLFLMLSLFLCFTKAHAQTEPDNVLTAPDVFGNRDFKKKSELPPKSEWAMLYLRFGKSIATDNNGNAESNIVGSFGIRRVADELMYGAEYTYHYMDNGLRFSDLDFTVGYHPNWNYSVVPYALIGGGLTFSSDSENSSITGGTGVNYFLDVGVELYKIKSDSFTFRVMSGLKFTHTTLTGGPSSSMDFDDAYIGIGFGF